MRRGEVWTVELPSTDGREQSGRRPAVVVQEDASGTRSPLVMVVPLSSRLEALRFPGCIAVDPSVENGLSVASVALGFQLKSIDRLRFRTRLGSLGETDLARVDDALRLLLGL